MHDLALLLFAFLWGLAGRGRGGPAPSRAPIPEPPDVLRTSSAPSTSPWPQVVPAGLPPFPGPQWEYDEPPPEVVQQRAGQLLTGLWRGGRGTYRIEQTSGRWIAYRADLVRGGKRGVVAYRLKKPVAAPPALPAPAPSRPSAPSAPAAPPVVNTSVNPPKVSPVSLPELRYGMGLRPSAPSPDVRLAQQRLITSGARITADGRFGPATRDAVMSHQRRRGLPATGIVDRSTWSALFSG